MNTKRERRQFAGQIFNRFQKIKEYYDDKKPKDDYGKTLTFPKITRDAWNSNFKNAEQKFVECKDKKTCDKYYNVLDGLDKVLDFIKNYDTGNYIGINSSETGNIKDFVENYGNMVHERMEPLTLWFLARHYNYLPVANPYNNNSFGYYY